MPSHDGSHKGITPAYKGSTNFTASFRYRCRGHPPRMWEALLGLLNSPASNADHPRIHGERLTSFCDFADIEPPPHTRGAQRRIRLDLLGRGIIPAYAGSTPVGWRLNV